jgi:Transposase DNA-binding
MWVIESTPVSLPFARCSGNSGAPGESILLVCQDWANTNAAYRFLDNDRVSEGDILAGHFSATRERFGASKGSILVLHDTTEFSFKREDIEAQSGCGTPEHRPQLTQECVILTCLAREATPRRAARGEWYVFCRAHESSALRGD